MFALLLLAASVGLSNFAGAIGIGVSGTDASIRWRIGVVFGAFEAGMPVVGLAVGRQLTVSLGDATRWAGAALLIAVGIYGLVDALSGRTRDSRRRRRDGGRDSERDDSNGHLDPNRDSEGARDRDRAPDRTVRNPQSTGRLLISGLALSLDNLAVGFALGTLAAGPVGILLSAVVIGSVSVAMSLAGLELGARIGAAAQHRSELFGAVILITVAAGIGTGVI